MESLLRTACRHLVPDFVAAPWLEFSGRSGPGARLEGCTSVLPPSGGPARPLEALPLRPGNVVSVYGPPGSGKTAAFCELASSFLRGPPATLRHFALLVPLRASLLARHGSLADLLWEEAVAKAEAGSRDELEAWLSSNEQRLLLAIDIDRNDLTDPPGALLAALLSRKAFASAALLTFADCPSVPALRDGFDRCFQLSGWRHVDVERLVLAHMQAAGSGLPARRLQQLRDGLMDAPADDCSPEAVGLLCMLITGTSALVPDVGPLLQGRQSCAGAFQFLLEAAAAGMQPGSVPKALKTVFKRRFGLVDGALSPSCYAEGGSLELGEFRVRSRHFDEFCAAKHLQGLFFKARRAEVAGAVLQDSEWWEALSDLWGQDGERFGETLPFLAALLPSDGPALLAPVAPIFRSASAELREQWRRCLRRCLEVAPCLEAAISAVLSPSELEVIRGPALCNGVAEESEAELEAPRLWRPRPARELARLFSGVGEELRLDLSGLVRSLLTPGDLDDDPWELLGPLAAMLGDVAACPGVRSLAVEVTVGGMCAEAARLTEDFAALEKRHLRELRLLCRALPSSAAACSNFGAATAQGLARSPHLRRLQLSSAFLTAPDLLPELAAAAAEHAKLRALVLEGPEAGLGLAHPKAVRSLAVLLRRPGWREVRLDLAGFDLRSDTGPGRLRPWQEEPPLGVGGGVGGAGWVSARLPKRRWASREDLRAPSPFAGSEALLGALCGLDGHPRLRHLHLRTGELAPSAHSVLLDLLIGCRRLKTLVVSAPCLSESLMAAVSSGLVCAMRLESLALEARRSAPIGAGAIFALVQAAVAAGRVADLRLKITAATAADLEPLPFAMAAILAAPRTPLSIRLDGEVLAPSSRGQAVLQALRSCSVPEGVTFGCHLTPM